MKIELKVKCEHDDSFETICLTGEHLKNILKNEPLTLLRTIEAIEKRFPEPLKDKSNYKENDSYLMMATASSTAF
jgi:hypothetical protein